jgi:signal transduction histidine kinase
MLAELIEVFVQDIAACLKQLEKTLADDDKVAFLSCSRAIAGAAATIGASQLELVAKSATDDSWPAKAQTALATLRHEAQRVEELLRTGFREPEIVDVEIASALHLDDAQLSLIDLHSFLNMFNVIASELYFLGEDLQSRDSLQPCRSLIESFAADLQRPADLLATLRSAPVVFGDFWEMLNAATRDLPDQDRVKTTTDNLRSILGVAKSRIAELEERMEFPDRWVAHDIDSLVATYQQVFAAIEKNSKGRYHIVFNVAAKADSDYLIHLDIQSVDGPSITMPAVLQDVLRDLMANARKYTNPGGTIQAGLIDDGTTLRLAVEDSGLGIPAHEVPRVVEMGYRASNVADRPTMGGGFGLTKAYWVATRFGGSMRIRSGRERGTRVVLTIPRPNSTERAPAGSEV